MTRKPLSCSFLSSAALALCSATAAQAQAPASSLDIGTAQPLEPSGERAFELGLQEGQGIIIDLTPIAASADPATASAASSVTPAMRIEDTAGKCLRAVPAQDGCPASSIAVELEAAAGPGTTRAALRAPSAGRYRLTLSLPQDPSLARYELLVRERPIPAPAQPTQLSLCGPSVLPAEPPESDACAQAYSMAEGGRTFFTFSTELPGRWVQIDMRSDAFDSVVELLGPVRPGEPVEVAPQIDLNDDAGGTRNSQLRRALAEPGEYVVLARSFSGGAGEYTLAVRELEPPTPRAPTSLVLGTPVSDTFAAAEIEPYHLFSLAAQAGQSVVIDVTSPLDTMLEAGFEASVVDLANPSLQKFATVASNDDTCALDPQLRLRFEEAMTLAIRVSLVGGAGESGPYIISARPGDEGGCPE